MVDAPSPTATVAKTAKRDLPVAVQCRDSGGIGDVGNKLTELAAEDKKLTETKLNAIRS